MKMRKKILTVVLFLVASSSFGMNRQEKTGTCWIIPGMGKAERCYDDYTKADCSSLFQSLKQSKKISDRPLDYRWYEGFEC